MTISLACIILISCKTEEEVRIPEMLEAANVRIKLDPDFSSLRADDIDNAKIVFSVFSENKNIDKVEISVQYYNFAGDSSYTRRLLRTFSQSEFDGADGAIRNVTYTSADLAALFGLASVNDLGGGDRFDFFNVTSLDNGLVFPDTVRIPGNFINISPGVVNTAATTSFTIGFTTYVACPIDINFATGDYLIEQVSGPEDPFFGNSFRWTSETVNITAVSPIERTFNGTYFTFDGTAFNFLLICGNILVGTTSSGLSCGGPTLDWQGTIPPATYDTGNDSEIIIELLDNVNGGCGLPSGEPMTLKLTKVVN